MYGSAEDLVELDFLTILLMVSLPWRCFLSTEMEDFRLISRTIPWGAVVTHGGSFVLAFILKVRSLRYDCPLWNGSASRSKIELAG